MHKIFLLMMAFVAVNTSSFSQQQRSFDFYLVPTLGFNVSYSTFQKGYKKEYYSIDRNTSTKDLYYGIGLQVRYLEDFQFTIRYAGSGIGAGYKHKTIYYSSGGFERISDRASSPVNILDATTEKELFDMRFFQKWQRPLHVGFNGMIGMRYISIVKVNRTDSIYPLPSLSISSTVQSKSWEKQFRNGGVCLSGGVSLQLFVKNHYSLKIGALYNYLLKPIMEYQNEVKTTAYVNGSYQTFQDDFNLFVGRHQVLFYVEYPIKLFKIRY